MASRRIRAPLALCLVALLATPLQASMADTEHKLSPLPVHIDPGPENPPPFTGTIIIRFWPRYKVTAFCPQGVGFYSLACTDPVSRVVTMPDEASSGLSEAQWLMLLRHEVLHAQGLDWHAP